MMETLARPHQWWSRSEWSPSQEGAFRVEYEVLQEGQTWRRDQEVEETTSRKQNNAGRGSWSGVGDKKRHSHGRMDVI